MNHYPVMSSGGKMSIFLMGVYDPSTFRWCTVTKCGNGLDDKTINRLQRELDVRKISRVSRHSSALMNCSLYGLSCISYIFRKLSSIFCVLLTSDNRALLSLDNSGLSWTVSAPDKVTAVPVRRNGNFQTPISVPAVRPNRCHTLSNPAHRQDYTVACLNYTLQTMMPSPGWPVMAPKCIRQQ